jgi:hypothetical protein
MRVRREAPVGQLFNGKWYASDAELQAAVDAWTARRRRLLALVLGSRPAEGED